MIIVGAAHRNERTRAACVSVMVAAMAVLLVALSGTGAVAQIPDTGQAAPPDSVQPMRVDTTGDEGFVLDQRLTDSSLAGRAPLDSNALRRGRVPAAEGAPLGTLLGRATPEATVIGQRDIVWMSYFTLFDVLAQYLPAYPLSQGGAGTVQAFTYLGADPSAVGLLFNGRPLRSTGGRAFDFGAWPVEFAERIEILRGARAALYGPDDGLIAINIVQPRFDVEGSYLRAWYHQGINNTTGGDITYARNVGRASNVTLGFRRLRSDGVFLQRNDSVTAWNARGAITWYPSRGLTLSLSEIFTDATRGQNNGLQPGSSRVPFEVLVINNRATERELRHDVTLNGRLYPFIRPAEDTDISFEDRIDSTVLLDGSLYYSYAEREFSDSLDMQAITSVVGARGGAQWRVGAMTLEGNGHAEVNRHDGLDVDVGGLISYDLDLQAESTPRAFGATVRGGTRLYEVWDGARLALFGEALLRRDDIVLRGTVRSTSIVTDAPYDSSRLPFGFLRDERSPLVIEVEIRADHGDLSLAAGGTMRVARPRGVQDSRTIVGGSLRAHLPLGNGLHFRTHAIITAAQSNDSRFPFVYDVSELFGRWRLLKGNLDLQIGTSFQFQSKFEGSEYDPYSAEFLYPSNPLRPSKLQFPSWDMYAEARLGTAYVRASFRNVLDNEFYTLYRYPIMGRGLYLSANWAFVD